MKITLFRTLLTLISATSIAITAAIAMANPPAYRVTDLGHMRISTFMIPVGINNSGQIVGWEKGKKGADDRHGFFWQRGRFTDLGTGAAYAINNRGEAVGNHERNIDNAYEAWFRGYYWHTGRQFYITEPAGSFTAQDGAIAINDQGFVLDGGTACVWHNGSVNRSSLPKHILMLNNTGNIPMETYDSDFQIYGKALNDNLEIAGLSDSNVALWTDGSVKTLIRRDNRTMPTVAGLNGADQVIGWLDHFDDRATFNHNQQAFVASPSGTQYLPLLPGDGFCVAYGINTDGEIVGKSGPHKGHSHAVIWKHGIAIDLNTLIPSHTGWILEAAHAINDTGQIVGVGTYNGRPFQAFLLTPMLRV